MRNATWKKNAYIQLETSDESVSLMTCLLVVDFWRNSSAIEKLLLVLLFGHKPIFWVKPTSSIMRVTKELGGKKRKKKLEIFLLRSVFVRSMKCRFSPHLWCCWHYFLPDISWAKLQNKTMTRRKSATDAEQKINPQFQSDRSKLLLPKPDFVSPHDEYVDK